MEKPVNRNTEYRRIARVRGLMLAGYSTSNIKKQLPLSTVMTEFYIAKVIYGVMPKTYKNYVSQQVVGVEFGNKTEQYYSPEYCEEDSAYEIPTYEYSDLSLDEKVLFHANLPKEWKIRIPQR